MSTQADIQQAATILIEAKQQVNATLEDSQHGMVLIGVNSGLDSLINRLAFLSGSQLQAVVTQDFPPVTEFMGEELVLRKQIAKEDLTPEEEEKENFITKVDTLYNQFDTISPEGILNSYTIPEDILVVRGVAKRAGVDGYSDRELTLRFIEDINKAIKQKALDEAEERSINKKLAEGASEDNEDGEDGEADETTTPDKPLAKWNKKQLQAELTKREIAFDLEATNKDLIKLIEDDNATRF